MRLDHLMQDVKLAFWALGRAPAFAAVAVLTLSVGIGANTAIFSVADRRRSTITGSLRSQLVAYM